MKKSLPNMIRILLVLMTTATLAMAFLWTPNVISYTKELISGNNAENVISVSVCALSTIITLISLTVYLISFKFPTAIESESIFTQKTAGILKLIAILIFADCFFFGVGIAVLFGLGDRLLAPALAFVDVIGIAISAMLLVLSRYVKDAAYLKEEVDCTL